MFFYIPGDEPAEVAHGLGDAFLIGRNDLAQVLKGIAGPVRAWAMLQASGYCGFEVLR